MSTSRISCYVPLAIAGGTVTTCTPTEHTRTNACLIERLLGVPVAIEALESDRFRITAKR